MLHQRGLRQHVSSGSFAHHSHQFNVWDLQFVLTSKNLKNSWCTRCIYLLRRYDDWHDGTPYEVLDPSWITVKKSHVRPYILNLPSVSNSAQTPAEGKLCHQIPLFQPGLRVLPAVEKHSMPLWLDPLKLIAAIERHSSTVLRHCLVAPSV